jgi:hypothetical protein
MKKPMTKKQAKALKRKILGLRWDINIKEAKLERFARLLVDNAHGYARITRADYRAFFKARRIKPTWA